MLVKLVGVVFAAAHELLTVLCLLECSYIDHHDDSLNHGLTWTGREP